MDKKKENESRWSWKGVPLTCFLGGIVSSILPLGSTIALPCAIALIILRGLLELAAGNVLDMSFSRRRLGETVGILAGWFVGTGSSLLWNFFFPG